MFSDRPGYPTWAPCCSTLLATINCHKFEILIYFNLFLESSNFKTKFYDYIDLPWNNFHFHIHSGLWNSIFTYWKHFIKICVSIIPRKSWNSINLKEKILRGLTFYSMWCAPLNSNMCWCRLGRQKHSIFTCDNWRAMICSITVAPCWLDLSLKDLFT
jgi:hypothetical protein